MKEFKGTKGPWRVSEKRGDMIDIRHSDSSIGAMSLNLARVAARKCWASEGEANAKLIAAAPDLLEALLRTKSQYMQAGIDAVEGSLNPVEDNHAFINAAISKALGE